LVLTLHYTAEEPEVNTLDYAPEDGRFLQRRVLYRKIIESRSDDSLIFDGYAGARLYSPFAYQPDLSPIEKWGNIAVTEHIPAKELPLPS
jgi:hypothetical protein